MSYQPTFDLLDKTIVALAERDDDTSKDALDLLKRFGYVTLNILNSSMTTFPHLLLPEGTEGASEVPEPEAENPSD